MKKYISTIMFLVLSLLFSINVQSQSLRGLVNDGVDLYEKNNFTEAEVKFKKGIEKDLENFESKFNLGDAIYKQGRFEESFEEFKNTIPLAKTDEEKSIIFHNIGNSLLKAQKLKESIGAYKEALKLNPNDMETKYNLSYALKQMQNQQNNQNQQNKDENKQNQDQNKQDQNNQDEQQDQKDKEEEQQQKDDKQNKDQKQDEQKQKPKEEREEISKEEAKRILDALKNNEAELQKKMRQQKSKKSNVEKDW